MGERELHLGIAKARAWSLVPILGGREKFCVGTQHISAGEIVAFVARDPGYGRHRIKSFFEHLEQVLAAG